MLHRFTASARSKVLYHKAHFFPNWLAHSRDTPLRRFYQPNHTAFRPLRLSLAVFHCLEVIFLSSVTLSVGTYLLRQKQNQNPCPFSLPWGDFYFTGHFVLQTVNHTQPQSRCFNPLAWWVEKRLKNSPNNAFWNARRLICLLVCESQETSLSGKVQSVVGKGCLPPSGIATRAVRR